MNHHSVFCRQFDHAIVFFLIIQSQLHLGIHFRQRFGTFGVSFRVHIDRRIKFRQQTQRIIAALHNLIATAIDDLLQYAQIVFRHGHRFRKSIASNSNTTTTTTSVSSSARSRRHRHTNLLVRLVAVRRRCLVIWRRHHVHHRFRHFRGFLIVILVFIVIVLVVLFVLRQCIGIDAGNLSHLRRCQRRRLQQIDGDLEVLLFFVRFEQQIDLIALPLLILGKRLQRIRGHHFIVAILVVVGGVVAITQAIVVLHFLHEVLDE
mmetsp:Transcript_18406/g.29195  ORF Transcript_18406/g.29195 Transcript_18406/m.29195 type:complete len:262 (-) Transcript_18406:317-1102(-)